MQRSPALFDGHAPARREFCEKKQIQLLLPFAGNFGRRRNGGHLVVQRPVEGDYPLAHFDRNSDLVVPKDLGVEDDDGVFADRWQLRGFLLTVHKNRS